MEDGNAAAGVHLDFDVDASDPSIETVYDISRTATVTDSTGTFLMINVPPDSVNFTATPLGFSSPTGYVTVQVRSGTLTEAYIGPTPTP